MGRGLIGRNAFGLRLPMIKKGDDIADIVIGCMTDAVYKNEYEPKDGDIIGITESVVARAQGLYCSVDDIANFLEENYKDTKHIYVLNPIFSRNRFSLILKGIARAFENVTIVASTVDEVGNDVEHKITKVNYYDYYRDIITSENATFQWRNEFLIEDLKRLKVINVLDCTLHMPLAGHILAGMHVERLMRYSDKLCMAGLQAVLTNKCHWGLLGSNKAGAELLKLFPDTHSSQVLVDTLKEKIEKCFRIKNVNVMIYGDGCYKDAESGIWEFADPVVSPAYTEGLKGSPNELKLKYLLDCKYKDLSGQKLLEAIENEIKTKKVEQGEMETQGTTPRLYVNLLGSLMDLISGSGDVGTPVVIVQNYFSDYSDNTATM